MAGFDITENPTFDLRGLSSSGLYTPTSTAWDVAIGGLPFLFADSQTYPYHRSTADWRRTRFDSGTDYGEQSLDTGFWTRDQASFHYGSGQPLAEAQESNPAITRYRMNYATSIDPWTPAKVIPSASPEQITTTSGTNPLAVGTSSGVLYANGTVLSLIATDTLSAITWTGVGAITSLCTDGANYYVADNAGIWRGALPSGVGAKAYTVAATTLIEWVKQRMIACVGPSVYEITDAPSAAGAALPTALYTHPVSSWTWTAIAEGPDAIYLAGYAGAFSTIYRVTVTTSGSTVVLGAPTVVAELPRNEVVNTLYGYAGTYLAIGTSAGPRLATMSSDGSLSVSPVLFSVTGGVYDFVGVDRFLYVTGGTSMRAADGSSAPGLYRVDLSRQTDTGFWAYAEDTVFTANGGTHARCVTVGSTGEVYATVASSTKGVVRLLSTQKNTNAWVVIPRIRMGTAENKVFSDVLVRGTIPTGCAITCFVSASGSGDPTTWTQVGSLGPGGDGSFALDTVFTQPEPNLYLAFQLTGTGAAWPEFNGYRLKVVPAPTKTRMIDLPLMCFDGEKDRNGNNVGYAGGSWERLAALEALEDAGDQFTFQDFTTGETRQAYIEKTQFLRINPPTRGYKNPGGIVTLSIRLL